ncbi:primosomal protein N' [bacterium]|nr:primosomal protein N' [bacterium]
MVIGKRGDSIEEPLVFFLPDYIKDITLGSFVVVEIAGRLRIGCVVGKGRGKAREPVLAVLPVPPLPSSLLALAHWLEEECLASLQDALQSMVPEILNAIPSLYLYPNVDYRKVRGKVRREIVREASEGASYATLRSLPATAVRKRILALLNAKILTPRVELSFRESKEDEKEGNLLPPVPKLLHSPSSIAHHPVMVLWGGNRLRRLGYYLANILEVIKGGGNVILVAPDVLTAEWIGNTFSQFIKRTIIYHRQLPLSQRFTLWVQLASSYHSTLVVGNRSALFLPLPNVRLIVVEGDGESSLFHQEPPYYEAGNVAMQRAIQEGGRVIFGSDLPSIARFSLVRKRKLHLIRLPFQSGEVEIKDIREEKKIIPSSTKEEIERVLNEGGRVVMIVNRRGLFYLVCRDCGNSFLCPSCNVPLIVYEGKEKSKRSLFCHLCGTFSEAPEICPQCGSYRISVWGIGIQRLVSAIRRLFPTAKISSFSSETPREAFWEADIVVATKSIVQWLEILSPSLTCVFDIDSQLSFPHFAQTDNVYRMLFTIRKESKRVIIHTKQPDNPIFTSPPLDFLERECRSREERKYPPFGHILTFLFDDPDESKAKDKAERLYEYILSRGFSCLPPFPSLYPKRKGMFRYLLVISCLNLPKARKILNLALKADKKLKWFLDVQESL